MGSGTNSGRVAAGIGSASTSINVTDEMIARRGNAEKRGRELMREYGRYLLEASEQFARNIAYAETITELTAAWSDMQMIRENDRSIRISNWDDMNIKKIFNVRAADLGYRGRK